MKTQQEKEDSLKVLETAIQTELQKKGKATLHQIAKEGKTFKITGFKNRDANIETSKGNFEKKEWVAFLFQSDVIGTELEMEASIILFRKNLYDLNDNTKIIPTTNKGLLGTLAAKNAFVKELEIKPIEKKCFVSQYNENNETVKVESLELVFEIIEIVEAN